MIDHTVEITECSVRLHGILLLLQSFSPEGTIWHESDRGTILINSGYESLHFRVTVRDSCNNWELSVRRTK